MSSILYLAYGSNLLPARLNARLGAVDLRGTAALPGWELRFHKLGADGSGKCNLVSHASARAHGAVYEISLAAKTRLDEIEGVGRGYSGVTIELADFGEVYVYLAEAVHIEETLVPFDWYHAFVLAGAELHNFPRDYCAQIAGVATRTDPDEARRHANRALLEAAAAS